MQKKRRRIFRFSIRFKLLLLSIALLSIPYIGYEYMRELERHLRSSLEDSLIDAARALAGPMHESYQLFPYSQSTPEHSLFIHSLNYPIQLDGYTDDWVNYLDWSESYAAKKNSDESGPLSFKLILGEYEQYLYGLLQVKDDRLVYHRPTSEKIIDSDYVKLVLGDEYAVKQQFYFTPSAPGKFNPFVIETVTDEWEEHEVTRYVSNVIANWQETDNGYNLEIAVPLYLLDKRMGIVVGDMDDTAGAAMPVKTGTAGADTSSDPGRLLRPSKQIEQIIRQIDTTPGRRIWVLDNQGQVLASSGSLRRDQSRHPLNLFYTIILPPISERFKDDLAGARQLHGHDVEAALDGKTASRWRLSPDEKTVIVSAATPIWVTNEVRGAVMVEETTNNIQMLQRSALVSLLNKTLLVFFLITLLLLLFASRLSYRLRRLSREASDAIDEHGRVIGEMTASRASDEIGELSRSYAAMLERLKQYNHYLEGLAGKLSHELRTPMAVVQSSLDNLENEIDHSDVKYLERAREGINRLSVLVTRLSEAARLEQALGSADKEETDLCQLLSRCVEGYQTAYSKNRFKLRLPDRPVIRFVSPDLFMQMLDKIVGNAVDFSPEDGRIDLLLTAGRDELRLDIINYGSQLPEEMDGQLFNSMVSLRRSESDGEPHLGLGLYIARLIAEFHDGRIEAGNLPDNSGVRFRVILNR